MRKLELYYMNDPLLREVSADIEAVDPVLVEYCGWMYDFMEMLRGAGLSAPQVGRLERFIVIHRSILPTSADEVLVNPVITYESDETITDEEGCLSFLSVREKVTRPAAVTVKYIDLNGTPKKLEAEGLPARVLVHEIEHLDGVLFIDHLSRLKRRLLQNRVSKKYSEMTADGKLGYLKK